MRVMYDLFLSSVASLELVGPTEGFCLGSILTQTVRRLLNTTITKF